MAGCSATAWLSMPARALVYEYRIASPGCTVGESSSFVEPFLRPDASGGGTTFSLFGSSTFFTPISVGVGGAPSDRVGCGARVPCGASIPGSRSPITMPTKSQQNPEAPKLGPEVKQIEPEPLRSVRGFRFENDPHSFKMSEANIFDLVHLRALPSPAKS